jgi:hypothetical protein
MAQKRFLIDAGFETNADSVITGNLTVDTVLLNGQDLATTLASAATTANAYTDTAVSAVIDSAPGVLDTLNELAAALGDDANFAASTASALGLKASIVYVDGAISAATPSFATLTGKPTTLAGYGITDSITSSDVTAQIDAATPSFSTLTGKPTTVAGYGITDGITASAVTTQVDAAQAAAVATVKSDMGHFHSSVQSVTSGQESTNVSATVAYTFTELANAKHYVVLVNRLVLRPSEYSVSGNVVTIAIGVIADGDEIEVTGLSV